VFDRIPPRIFVTFMIGTKLAHYQITAHLGSGGMGDVYQATDAKLGRSVAIKLLPEAFALDTERVARDQIAGPSGGAIPGSTHFSGWQTIGGRDGRHEGSHHLDLSTFGNDITAAAHFWWKK
jgi:serine/threonine protein kinase